MTDLETVASGLKSAVQEISICAPYGAVWAEVAIEKIEAAIMLLQSSGWVKVPEGWQPIETAPKDGAQILTFDANMASEPIAVSYWEPDPDIVGTWRDDGGDPTHWMPLPSPPDKIPLLKFSESD